MDGLDFLLVSSFNQILMNVPTRQCAAPTPTVRICLELTAAFVTKASPPPPMERPVWVRVRAQVWGFKAFGFLGLKNTKRHFKTLDPANVFFSITMFDLLKPDLSLGSGGCFFSTPVTPEPFAQFKEFQRFLKAATLPFSVILGSLRWHGVTAAPQRRAFYRALGFF